MSILHPSNNICVLRPLGLEWTLEAANKTLLLSFYGLHASAVILIPGLNGSTKLYSLAVT